MTNANKTLRGYSSHYSTARRRRVVFAALLVCIALQAKGCLFVTREPEPPDTRRSSFQPPTSSQIVIANFQAALREKNVENYIQCLVSDDSATSLSARRRYIFEPSAEAAARFSGVFAIWNTAKERQAFLALTASISPQSFPVLQLSNSRFELLTPDSAVYVSDYLLRPNYQISGAPEEFSGTLRFTIASFPNGFWAISRWSDQTGAQSPAPTWSVLKAQFAN